MKMTNSREILQTGQTNSIVQKLTIAEKIVSQKAELIQAFQSKRTLSTLRVKKKAFQSLTG